MDKKNICVFRFCCFAFSLLIGMSACLYKMPNDDDIRIVPTTNNPHVIKDTGAMAVPGIDY